MSLIFCKSAISFASNGRRALFRRAVSGICRRWPRDIEREALTMPVTATVFTLRLRLHSKTARAERRYIS